MSSSRAAWGGLVMEHGLPRGLVPTHMARSLEEDLLAEGIPKQTPDGKLDFHACRTAYVNLVLAAGVDAKTAQEAARRGSLELTMNVHGRVREQAMRQLANDIGEAIIASPVPEYCETRTERLAAGAESLCAASGYMVEDTGFEPAGAAA